MNRRMTTYLHVFQCVNWNNRPASLAIGANVWTPVYFFVLNIGLNILRVWL